MGFLNIGLQIIIIVFNDCKAVELNDELNTVIIISETISRFNIS